jgi:hypothetical protein
MTTADDYDKVAYDKFTLLATHTRTRTLWNHVRILPHGDSYDEAVSWCIGKISFPASSVGDIIWVRENESDSRPTRAMKEVPTSRT